ncbi:hypothetical protein O3M35_003093 [Rhynocoris fuscipes]|uniref:Peptidyl-prolyl cis-trans isomerase n=1 Tax=Rhynocoris fuscipes TaxID=488301 RepID=A0AAW1CL96_9HEMI
MKQPIGRLIMEIWMDIAPVTGCNFLNLCKSYGGYSYKHTPFHRIVKGLFFIGGDVVNKSGTGIYSVYGGVNSTFGDENAILEFNGPGVIAAHTVFAGDNHSQFLITFTKLTSMNKNFIVFGRAVGGQRVLDIIEGYGTKGGRPLKDIYITDCGILGGTKVPKPSTMRLPLKISPASSEEKFSLQTVYDPQYKQVIDPYKSNALIREQLIKKARKELKHMKMPIYKLSMDPIDSTANIDCVKAFAKRNKKNERNL